MPVGTTEEQVARLLATAEAVPLERPRAHLDTRARWWRFGWRIGWRIGTRRRRWCFRGGWRIGTRRRWWWGLAANRGMRAAVVLAQRVAHRDMPAEVVRGSAGGERGIRAGGGA